MKIRFNIDQDMLDCLGALDPDGDPVAVLYALCQRVRDGVTRPGSWERPWLYQVFGETFEDRLEQHPTCHWREQPRKNKGGRDR